MKQTILTILLAGSTFFVSVGQLPEYEYRPYSRSDRKATVTLPDLTVQLKRTLKEEKNSFKQPQRFFIVSDIEGEYERFKGLLQAAGVIDQKARWIYGSGHLAVCGDVFDRGSQVTECLWLIYHLEEQAKEDGGYVHFVLGNHEIMVLNGDLRYLNPKYHELARQKGIDYSRFYAKDTELGRWLHTKNIAEKVGNLLLVHAGVSPYLNQWQPQLDLVNEAARLYYDRYNDSLLTPEAELLLLDEGPLWYRGYYHAPLATQAQIDSTLRLFDVDAIVTGHTPVKRISRFYNGKVINVDVPHARGVSEGLLIENKKYYRINLQGEKEPLGEHNRL